MKKLQNFAVFYLFMVFLLNGCGSTLKESQSDQKASRQNTNQDSADFFKLFSQELAQNPVLKGLEGRFLYLPPNEFFQESNSIDNEYKFLDAKQNQMGSYSAADIYSFSERARDHITSDLESGNSCKNEDSLANTTPTIVFINGLGGELVDVEPYSDILNLTHSQMAVRWHEINRTSPILDEVFSLKNGTYVAAPIDVLVKVASFDDRKKGFNFIYLKPTSGSLESLGKIKPVADQYRRRLDKTLAALNIKGPVFLMGHSRGAMIGLQMLADGERDLWALNAKGLVSLAGDLYGSDIADEWIYQQNSDVKNILDSFADFDQNAMKLTGQFLQDTSIIRKNHWLFMGLIKNIGKASVSVVDFEALKFLFGASVKQVSSLGHMLLDPYKLPLSLSAYNQNLSRIKIFLAAISDAAYELTTPGRLSWWKENTLPQKPMLFYSFGAVMNPADLSDFHYNKDTIDFVLLKKAQKKFVDLTHLDLNDSQLGLNKVVLWPKLNQFLNKNQIVMEQKVLPLIINHHWGVALKKVEDTRSGSTNPYPRDVLIRALAQKLRYDSCKSNDK